MSAPSIAMNRVFRKVQFSVLDKIILERIRISGKIIEIVAEVVS